MFYTVQPLALLVIALDNVPGRFIDRGALEHLFLGRGVLLPADPAFQIHR